MKYFHPFVFAFVLGPALLFTGCTGATKKDPMASTSGTPAARDGLMDLAELLKEIKTNGGKVPAANSDFAPHDAMHPAAGALSINGTIIYLFGATVDTNETALKLVAMQKDADKSGGWVLLSNGEVKDLPAAEVAALPLGGKMPKK